MTDDLVMDLLKRVSELERRLNDTVIYGVVSAVQYNPYRVKVNYGTPDKPQHTAFLSVMAARAASAKTWWPLEVDEAVMVISPNGNTKLGRVYPATYSQDLLQPDDDPDRCWIEFGQGNRCYIERDTGKLYFKLNSEIELDVGSTNVSFKSDSTTITTPAFDLNKS